MNSPTVKAQSLPAWTQCKSKGDDEPFDLLKPFALVGNTILVSEFCSYGAVRERGIYSCGKCA